MACWSSLYAALWPPGTRFFGLGGLATLAVMAARLLGAARGDLQPLLSGGTRYTVGIGEVDAAFDLGGIETRAEQGDGGWVLHGRKSVVYGGASVDRFLVDRVPDPRSVRRHD